MRKETVGFPLTVPRDCSFNKIVLPRGKNKGSITLIGRIPYGGFAEFYTSRVKRHVSILRAAAQQHVFELLEVALLTEAEHERPSDIRRVFHRQLEQRAGLLQLLHEPHAWGQTQLVCKEIQNHRSPRDWLFHRRRVVETN